MRRAVWVTYSPDLPADDVAALTRPVEGIDSTMMSRYPELPNPDFAAVPRGPGA